MDLIIDFYFSLNEDGDINNGTIYRIRKYVVEMFRDYGFGDIVEEENDLFSNIQARPYISGFVDDTHREMYIGYRFNARETNNLPQLLTTGIPNLYDTIDNNFPFIVTSCRLAYQHH